MNYYRQIEEIVNYFRRQEKKKEDYKIGLELEHFIVDKNSLKAISYYGDGGIEQTLKKLLNYGWKGKYEGKYILGLEKNGNTITLEPGSQFELSINSSNTISKLEDEYFEFLDDLLPILDRKNQALIATGYQPESKIDEIKLLPKKRYSFMYDYFKDKGSLAHNMMKGTAALQISFDYSSEEDYIKKFKVASGLSPVGYALFDNSFYFEGSIWDKYNLRSLVWENCDVDRCGIVDVAMDNDFGYEKYAEYILKRPVIFVDDGEGIYYTGDKLFKEIFNPDDYSIDELEHVLTMFFPDVRTKKYIEVRMMDGVPYPLNFAAVAFWKGILYNEKNLDEIYKQIVHFNILDLVKAKAAIVEHGLSAMYGNKTVQEIGLYLIDVAKSGLNNEEVKYISPLEKMISENKNPYKITSERQHLGKSKALNWCVVNNLVR